MDSQNKDPKKNISALSLGFNLAIGMALFTWLGMKTDQIRDTGQFWTIIGIFLGLGYISYELWKLVRQTNE